MRIVGAGMFLHTVRNILPMFDLEQRKEAMGTADWGSLANLQGMGSIMNIMLTVNCFDRGTTIISVTLALMTYIGMVDAYRGIEKITQAANWGNVIFCVIGFQIFIHIQKRLHKEVYTEIKERVEQGNEFKTIFNEFDEGVMILKSNKIV